MKESRHDVDTCQVGLAGWCEGCRAVETAKINRLTDWAGLQPQLYTNGQAFPAVVDGGYVQPHVVEYGRSRRVVRSHGGLTDNHI